jgi:LmbE family N-acetylglucosaminyl deacetylase
MSAPPLEPLPEDWDRGLAIAAHPDDMEYGAAAAVARWTGQGKHVAYALVTDGEKGIADLAPEETAPLRRAEQVESCRVVGVEDVEFLGLPDGSVVEGLALRSELAAVVRSHRPDVVVAVNHRDSWGGPSWNHADHRAVGRALLDAVRDAANPWMFPERGEAWSGVRFVAFNASPEPTHAVDVSATFETGVQSLLSHRTYLEHLGGDPDETVAFLRRSATGSGERLGVDLAVTFEVIG